MKKYFLLIFLSTFIFANADAQGILKKLKEKAVNAVTEKLGDKVEKEVGDAADDVLNNDSDSESSDEAGDDSQPTATRTSSDADDIAYAKSDFVPGDVVIFEDNLTGEQLGEFPSRWDLENGNSEVARISGENAIELSKDECCISPLMKDNSRNYLGDVYTVEFDALYDDRPKDGANTLIVNFMPPECNVGECIHRVYINFDSDTQEFRISYARNGSESKTDMQGEANGTTTKANNDGQWHHYAISFNKRAMKLYFDGSRIVNIPNAVSGAGWIAFESFSAPRSAFLKNVRIAKGAVPLYDRLATDGKIVTYAITFDIGKSTIKPQSMTEISRIQKLMQTDSSLKFEVQGHCDNTGNADTNDRLSQARAEAIVAKLVSMGIDKSRLTAVGKGSREPVADNSTEEGKAKNRRVEFVKK